MEILHQFTVRSTVRLAARALSSGSRQSLSVRASLIAGTLILGCAVPQAAWGETVTRSVLRAGSQNADVNELQATLKLLGFFDGAVDGFFSDSTTQAVIRFQAAAGVAQDGVVGQATWDRLFPPSVGIPSNTQASTYNPAPAAQPRPAAPAAANPYPILRRGAKGAAVLGLQSRLRAIGVFNGTIDGVFGEETQAAVEAAQRQSNLDPDGIVGPSTWEAILR